MTTTSNNDQGIFDKDFYNAMVTMRATLGYEDYSSTDEDRFEEEMPGYILTGPGRTATKEMLEIIPEDVLTDILAMKRVFCLDSSRIMKNEPNFPRKRVRQLVKILEDLKNKHWLSDIGIRRCLEEIAYSERGAQYISVKLHRKLMLGSKGGRPIRDIALNLMIIVLAELLIKTREGGRSDFKLIADFLNEQMIGDHMTEGAIRQRYKRNRNSQKKLMDTLKRQVDIFNLELAVDTQGIEIEEISEKNRPWIKRIDRLPIDVRNKLYELIMEELH